jgi:hypothetical protein
MVVRIIYTYVSMYTQARFVAMQPIKPAKQTKKIINEMVSCSFPARAHSPIAMLC